LASKGALTHVRNYASTAMLAALAGIITFPIMTRSLTVGEYGVLGLITASATVFIAFGKMGMQHAVIRFYAQIKNDNIHYNLGQINSTVTSLLFVLAAITSFIWVVLGYTVLPKLTEFENISQLFVIAGFLVFLRMVSSGLMSFLRAQQRSGVVGFSHILVKFSYLGFILFFVVSGMISVGWALVSMVFAEIITISYAAKKYGTDWYFKFKEVSSSLGKAMLLYSVPLMMMELLGLVMRLSDRYIIQIMLDENALGMYSASYNLVGYLDIIMIGAVVQAIRPYYMQLWESEGLESTQSFLSDGLRTYFAIGIPIVALFSLVSPHLMSFLASPKYAPGTIIIPFVALSFLIEGSTQFSAAGLFVKKNTSVLMFWGAVTTVLNLVLNILAVPRYGIVGPAVVTIISYSVFVFFVSRRAFKDVAFNIEWRVPVVVSIWSLVVFAALFKMDFGGDLVNLLCKGAVGGVLLAGGISIIDTRSRDWVINRIRPAKTGVKPDIAK